MANYRVLTCLITVAFLAGCSEGKDQKTNVDMHFSSPQSESWTAEETTYVKSLIHSFAKQCKPLAQYWSDVESAELSIEPAIPYMEDMGWKRSVYVKVKIKEASQLIPHDYRAWGHTCHYNLGSNQQEAGLFASKSPCKRLCEMGDYQRVGHAISTPAKAQPTAAASFESYGQELLTAEVGFILPETDERIIQLNDQLTAVSKLSGLKQKEITQKLLSSYALFKDVQDQSVTPTSMLTWLTSPNEVGFTLVSKKTDFDEILRVYLAGVGA